MNADDLLARNAEAMDAARELGEAATTLRRESLLLQGLVNHKRRAMHELSTSNRSALATLHAIRLRASAVRRGVLPRMTDRMTGEER